MEEGCTIFPLIQSIFYILINIYLINVTFFYRVPRASFLCNCDLTPGTRETSSRC